METFIRVPMEPNLKSSDTLYKQKEFNLALKLFGWNEASSPFKRDIQQDTTEVLAEGSSYWDLS